MAAVSVYNGGCEMNGTWGQIGLLWLYEPKKYTPPEELQRLERVAVGRICGCKSCLCCEELKKEVNKR